MKAEAKSAETFAAVSLTITFESQSELDEFYNLFYLRSIRNTLEFIDVEVIKKALRSKVKSIYGLVMYKTLQNEIRKG